MNMKFNKEQKKIIRDLRAAFVRGKGLPKTKEEHELLLKIIEKKLKEKEKE